MRRPFSSYCITTLPAASQPSSHPAKRTHEVCPKIAVALYDVCTVVSADLPRQVVKDHARWPAAVVVVFSILTDDCYAVSTDPACSASIIHSSRLISLLVLVSLYCHPHQGLAFVTWSAEVRST